MRRDPWSTGIGLGAAAAALAALVLWIPNDTETGLVETFRRSTVIGDALAPSAVAILLAALGLWMAAAGRLGRAAPIAPGIDRASLDFLGRLAAVLAAGFALLAWTGPAAVGAVNALGGEIGSYRMLLDTPPYKYLGFLLGGFVLAFGSMVVVAGRPRRRDAVAAAAAVAALAALVDLPFEDLLLPPNGDQ